MMQAGDVVDKGGDGISSQQNLIYLMDIQMMRKD
jgi:hypothetical protein